MAGISEFRINLHKFIQEQLQELNDENAESILTGWVLITEVKAPSQHEDDPVGVDEGFYLFSSEAMGLGDLSPWIIHGFLRYSLWEFDDLFYGDTAGEDD